MKSWYSSTDWYLNHPLQNFIDNLRHHNTCCLSSIIVDGREFDHIRTNDLDAFLSQAGQNRKQLQSLAKAYAGCNYSINLLLSSSILQAQ